ncbi:6524_t:CDS:1, partial [Gigaspora margarita]
SLDFAVGVAVVSGKLSPLVSLLLVKIRRCVGIVYGEIRRWCRSWNFAVNVAFLVVNFVVDVGVGVTGGGISLLMSA